MQRIFIKQYFSINGGKCLSLKVAYNGVKKFSQGRSKVADDARLGRPVQIATEAKISMLCVSTHGRSVSMFVEDLLRNVFSKFRISFFFYILYPFLIIY
jgi:hypothetical protein